MDDRLAIALKGDLATILNFANGTKKNPRRGDAAGVQGTLVAGARSHLYRTHIRYMKLM